MLVRVSDGPPYKENRDRKHQRLGHDPRKTEAFATEARIDFANNQGADDPPLDTEPPSERRHQHDAVGEQLLELPAGENPTKFAVGARPSGRIRSS